MLFGIASKLLKLLDPGSLLASLLVMSWLLSRADNFHPGLKGDLPSIRKIFESSQIFTSRWAGRKSGSIIVYIWVMSLCHACGVTINLLILVNPECPYSNIPYWQLYCNNFKFNTKIIQNLCLSNRCTNTFTSPFPTTYIYCRLKRFRILANNIKTLRLS